MCLISLLFYQIFAKGSGKDNAYVSDILERYERGESVPSWKCFWSLTFGPKIDRRYIKIMTKWLQVKHFPRACNDTLRSNHSDFDRRSVWFHGLGEKCIIVVKKTQNLLFLSYCSPFWNEKASIHPHFWRILYEKRKKTEKININV